MSNSFRVGSISAAMNFSTGGFMQGVREVVNATGGSLPQDIGMKIAAAPLGWDVTNMSTTAGLLRYGAPSARPVPAPR